MGNRIQYSFLFILGIILFIPFLGQVHLFDWDEINFAECAREMIVSKDYLRMQIDFVPFYEKPPLFIWLQVLSMKCFGINEFSSRFPNALVGITTLMCLYHIGKKVANEKIALIWISLYLASWLPHFYFKTGIIDPLFNLFIFLAIYQFYRLSTQKDKTKYIIGSGVFLGLAVLTKGPVALLVAALCLIVFIIIKRGFYGFKFQHLLVIMLISLAITASWFGIEFLKNGTKFIEEFISYQAGLFSQNIADHEEPWYYHPIVLLIGCFPASVFLFQYGFKNKNKHRVDQGFSLLMWIMFWVVLILFSIVKTKIVHYSSLCYYPICYLAALQIYNLLEHKSTLKKGVKVLLLVLAIVWSIVLIALPIVGMYKSALIPYIKDPFAVANLQAQVPWHWYECLIGVVYLFVLLYVIISFKNNTNKKWSIIVVLQVVTIQIVMTHFTPKIEAYSQRAVIDFYESKKGQDVYVQVLGFRSYAHLFYTQKSKSINPNYYHQDWLLNGAVDKPTYLVCKIQDVDYYQKIETLRELYRKNGFVFFERIVQP